VRNPLTLSIAWIIANSLKNAKHEKLLGTSVYLADKYNLKLHQHSSFNWNKINTAVPPESNKFYLVGRYEGAQWVYSKLYYSDSSSFQFTARSYTHWCDPRGPEC
jgi:hypothetical protein